MSLRRPRAALAATAFTLSASLAQAACGEPPAKAMLERFLSADCETCWHGASEAAPATLLLDWIVPSAQGDAAPLSVAALSEAAQRAGELVPDRTLQRRHALPARPGLRLTVEDGPAWNGYIGARLRVTRSGAAWPPGAVGYLALVEHVPAGEEGTPVARQLVRAVTSPLPLADGPATTSHLRSLRIVPGSRVERLSAVGWVEAPPGHVVAAAGSGGRDCTPTR